MSRPLTILFVLSLTACAAAQEADQCAVVATLLWPGHDLSKAQVRVYRDKERKDLVAAFPTTDAGGKVAIIVPAGTYHLMVEADNGDDKFGPGDGLGFHGVTDPNAEQPQPLEVKEKAWAVVIPISLMVGDDGKLGPTGVTQPEPPPPPKTFRIAGRLVDRNPRGLLFVYAVPKAGQCQAVKVAADSTFALTVAATEVYLFAVQDVNDSLRADAGDLMAVHGYEPGQGREFPLVKLEEDLIGLQLKASWLICTDGLLRSTIGEGEGPTVAPETFPAVAFGRLLPPTLDPVTATVRAAADAKFQNLTASVRSTDGKYALCVQQGTYFLSFFRDIDNSGQASARDDLGFQGVTDLAKDPGPQPLVLVPGDMREVDLRVSARLNDALQPVPAQ